MIVSSFIYFLTTIAKRARVYWRVLFHSQESEDSDSDQPLASRLSSASRKPKKAIPMADDDDSEDDIPLAARKLPMSNGTSKSNGTKVKRRVSDSDSDSEVPLVRTQ